MKRTVVLCLIFSFVLAQSPIIQSQPGDNDLVVQKEPNLSHLALSNGVQTSSSEQWDDPNDKEDMEDPKALCDNNDSNEPYLIESGDVLEIIVLGEEELTRTVVVMHNGNIALPLIGEVKVIDLTAEQAEKLIAQELTEYYTHPIVSVILKSSTEPTVSVFGEILKPGAIPFQRGLRITDYIALAGGPTGKANLGKVRVIRFVKGEPTLEQINVDAIMHHGITDQNYELKSGDWMYLDKKFTVNWSTILQLATLTLTALNVYLTIQRMD